MPEAAANRQIAKNTVYLYVRTAVTMLISLYASRVVLKQLGASDYGVYSVIAGVVATFAALSATLSGATQRYITFAIGKGDREYLGKIFTASVRVHAILAAVILLLAETLGVWFINNRMNLPPDRMTQANIIFQTAAFAFIADILTLPFMSAVVAYEKFRFYAVTFIAQAFLRLGFVLSLCLWNEDKLLVYAFCELMVALSSKLAFVIYTRVKLRDCSIVSTPDRSLYKDIVSFTGLNFMGTASSVIYTQGSGIVLNKFCGVLLNAALGLATQVQGAVNNFVASFTVAVNPQITKTYAAGEYGKTSELVMFGAKISSYLMLVIAFPLIANIDYLLQIWLDAVPDYTRTFVCFAILSSYIAVFNIPLNTLIFATGKIGPYQLACVIINVTSIFLLILCFRLGVPSYSIYLILIAQSLLKLIVMLVVVSRSVEFPVGEFVRKVYLRGLALCCPVIAVLWLKDRFAYAMTFPLFVVESVAYVCIILILIYLWGMNAAERTRVKDYFNRKFHKCGC